MSQQNQTPTRPRYRSMVVMARDNAPGIPWWIAGDPLKTVDGSEGGAPDFIGTGQFAVLVKPLKARQQVAYLSMYGCTIDADVRKIFWVFQEIQKLIDPKMAEMLGPSMLTERTDPDTGVVTTDIGRTRGSSDAHILHVCTHLLAAHGRIVGMSGIAEYDTVPVSTDDVLDHLPSGARWFELDAEDDNQFFYALLQESGVWDAEEVIASEKETGGLKDDDLKNSAAPSGAGSPGSATPPRRRGAAGKVRRKVNSTPDTTTL